MPENNNTKISHIDSKVVDDVIRRIESNFGEMTKTRGQTHDFLGMNISFDKGKVQIEMKRYLKEARDESMLGIVRQVATPATQDLYEVDDDSPPLDDVEAQSP